MTSRVATCRRLLPLGNMLARAAPLPSHVMCVVGAGQRWVTFYGLEFLTLMKFNFRPKGFRNLDDWTRKGKKALWLLQRKLRPSPEPSLWGLGEGKTRLQRAPWHIKGRPHTQSCSNQTLISLGLVTDRLWLPQKTQSLLPVLVQGNMAVSGKEDLACRSSPFLMSSQWRTCNDSGG